MTQIAFIKYRMCICAFPTMVQFPDVASNIRGEENDTFSNAAGETATVRVSADAAETAECLLRLLAGDAAAAELLTQEVHRDVAAVPDGEMPDLPMDGFNFANMGIWVDPIGE